MNILKTFSLRKPISYLACLFFLLTSAGVSGKITFDEYLDNFKAEATEKGYPAEFVNQAFANIKNREKAKARKKVVKADKNQPERKITLDAYLDSRVPDWKVKRAVILLNENKALLQRVEDQFGVQKRFIVALWGNESNFGNIQGKHPVVNSLIALAYDGRRETFFRKQLFAALDILQQGHISLDKFVGSWAGAMGQSQFMPTSFLDYAIDFDGDGKKDIWHNKADVFASIANFLKQEGWSDQITWGRQVKLPAQFDLQLSGLKRSYMQLLSDWQALGITRYNGEALPNAPVKASLIAPDGVRGRIYLVYENFHTLMKWNRSSYFGVSVSYLSDRIKKGA